MVPAPVYVWSLDGVVYGWNSTLKNIEEIAADIRKKKGKIVFLNALVPPNKAMFLFVTPITWNDLVKLLIEATEETKIESYIGHPATAELLSNLLGRKIEYNRTMYNPQEGDIAVVVRLKKRLEKPEDIKDIKPEDLEVLLVWYLPSEAKPDII